LKRRLEDEKRGRGWKSGYWETKGKAKCHGAKFRFENKIMKQIQGQKTIILLQMELKYLISESPQNIGFIYRMTGAFLLSPPPSALNPRSA
jgi:hypothetical protein